MKSGEEGTDSEDANPAKPRRRPWWHRTLESEERQRVMDDLAMKRVDHWGFRFTVMITLSAIVAVMGLSLNSAAVVIGAMLLAPLMQPVLATGASLSMALYRKAFGAFLRVALATVWCVAIAFFLAKFTPGRDLTQEVLARTQPNIKDLVVALAAGTAGAYATVRADVSAALPGVAVAVALVPPLGSAGIVLAAGEPTMAWGALLLYTTNLAAIIFASISVFVLTGFVPPRRIASTIKGVSMAKLGLAVFVGIIAYPLYQASASSVGAAEDLIAAESSVKEWLDGADIDANVDVGSTQIRVSLRGPDRPPPQELLEADLAGRFPQSEVLVEWVRTEQIVTTTTRPPDPSEKLMQLVDPVVAQWLDDSGSEYELEEVTIEGEIVRIDASGAGAPPSIDELDALLDESVDEPLSPRLNWTERRTLRPGEAEPTPVDQVQDRMNRFALEWAVERNVELRYLVYDGESVEIEIAGEAEPSSANVGELNEALTEFHGGPQLSVQIYFLGRRNLSA